jgi:ADP-ribosylglycohydrolase
MAAGCWLAEQSGSGESALEALSEVWPQAVQSEVWPQIPETEAQAQYVRDWVRADIAVRRPRRATYSRDGGTADVPALEQRVRGAWLGLALGDALGAAQARGDTDRGELVWSQHAALTLCAVESLLAMRRFDARDQIERFVRWQREGHVAGAGANPAAALTPDVAKALATYQWRRLAMAGSHDPNDNAPNSLPRVLAAVTFDVGDPAGAVALAAECSRTTHQSPLILDACRLYAATLVGALRGDAATNWIAGLPATTPSCWDGRPLHPQVLASATADAAPAAVESESAGVVQVLATARRIVADATTFASAMQAAWHGKASDYALHGALVGTLYGVRHGVDALPEELRARMPRASTVEAMAERCIRHVQRVLA